MQRLQNKHILLTREKEDAKLLAERITEAGGTPHYLPLINIVYREPLEKNYAHISEYDWLVFTSANGVRSFFSNYKGGPIRGKIAAVGKKTAKILECFHQNVAVIPNVQIAESLAQTLLDHITQRDSVLVIKGQLAGQVLIKTLTAANINVDELVTYDTAMPHQVYQQAARLPNITFDYVTLTSASTATHFHDVLQECPLSYKTFACIGPKTRSRADQLGLTPTITAQSYSAEGLFHAIMMKEEQTDERNI
ncbi:uroporphyrinogen-III synthase [Shouchella sp. 1P09AA]|uniref:uroporphyrinogen-III synthase n=1 Tax=unclassified Shouchella TaxID=2893065 RepID=UPI0039A08429